MRKAPKVDKLVSKEEAEQLKPLHIVCSQENISSITESVLARVETHGSSEQRLLRAYSFELFDNLGFL